MPRTGRRGGRRCTNPPCRSNKEATTEAPPSCLRDQAEAGTGGSNNSIPVLTCQPDGRYQPIQCHKNICICVDEWTGSSLDGTGIQNGTPDCSRPLPHARVWPGCTGKVKSKFMQDLKKFLLSKVEGGERSTGPDSAGQSVEQFSALTHFRSLDLDSNSFLERREKKAVKRLFRSNPKLRGCGKNLTKYCDVNRDRRVSQEEWLACVTLHNNQTDEPRPPPPPGGDWNPFEHILKSES
ncbi:hypothetical protein Pmani_036406 [Petrolisthes manimaculis]|uniref:Thyroglobulin type-1 domain-containing protein n=1 Tax=Petrolisthes manimaculis TaxID=1843537 RepID=A0AAE1NL25_9EUCA|nr:hypothetical protein Pmani_036406 [Petrolisthes manimaculis]